MEAGNETKMSPIETIPKKIDLIWKDKKTTVTNRER